MFKFNRTKIFAAWLPSATAVVLAAAFAYGTGQMILRGGANDAQVVMARDAVVALEGGLSPQAVVHAASTIDAETSLAPFIIVYDEKGDPVAGDGAIDNRIPTPPKGVFAYTKMHGEDRVTWQPKPGLRFAAIIVPWTAQEKSGYVLAACALKETEQRTAALLRNVCLGILISLFLTLIATVASLALSRDGR